MFDDSFSEIQEIFKNQSIAEEIVSCIRYLDPDIMSPLVCIKTNKHYYKIPIERIQDEYVLTGSTPELSQFITGEVI